MLFEDEGGHHIRGNLRCPDCTGYYRGEKCEECNQGIVHVEMIGEDCTSDFSDCWDINEYRCDNCNSKEPI